MIFRLILSKIMTLIHILIVVVILILVLVLTLILKLLQMVILRVRLTWVIIMALLVSLIMMGKLRVELYVKICTFLIDKVPRLYLFLSVCALGRWKPFRPVVTLVVSLRFLRVCLIRRWLSDLSVHVLDDRSISINFHRYANQFCH